MEYLESHFGEDVSLHRIYRYLDNLDDTQRDAVQAVSVRHTMAVHGGTLGVLFYDVTTLYFETDKPDDAKWDGLKGYVINAKLTDSEVVRAYHQLYNVEQSFRISKSSLEMRPMFHFTGKRIKAHVCICFVALKVYRELERLLKENKMDMSVDTVLSIAKTVVTICVAVPGTDRTVTRTLLLTPRQKSIQPPLEDAFWEKAKLPQTETKPSQ